MSWIASPQATRTFEWVAVIFWVLVIYVEFIGKSRVPRFFRILFWLPGKFLRILLIVVTLGFLLTACASSDPLPVAHGPLFQLNATNWQATPQDLSAPPKVANN